MKLEDYSKYYIQGSDHYLIPKDEFEELYEEMNDWREEAKELNIKLEDRAYEELKLGYDKLQKENEILRENALHNDKVVDKVNFENQLLKDRIEKAIEHINQPWILADYETGEEIHKNKIELEKILKGENNG